MTRFIIIRHGETNHNKAHIIQGQLDTPLNARGEEQAEEVAKILRKREPNIEAVFSSSLTRAYKTAEIIAGENLPVCEVPGFRERYMGQLEGMTREKALIKRDHDGRKSLLDYGESAEHLVKRLLTAWDELKEMCDERNYKTVALVSHGGALHQLFTAFHRQGYGFANEVAAMQFHSDRKIGNCSVTIIDSEKREFELYADQWVASIVRERDQL